MNPFAQLQAGLEPYPGYRLVRVIGRGGFAEVWEAETNEGGRLALKFIPADNPSVASREIRAIQWLRQLDHLQLIRIEQVWCHLGFVVIAMELAEGSLLDLLNASLEENGAPIPLALVIDYLTQAAGILDFLNTRQHPANGQRVAFQHCDVKPSNLLLCGDTVKLCDFGLAVPTTAVLRMHQRAGTMDFAAPEVFQGRLSSWTDQYALAVTYCQLRGGQLPFANSPDGFEVASNRPAPDLTMLPRAERPILARALSVVPQDRWPSCMEMMAQLAALSEAREMSIGIPPIVDNVVENPLLLEHDMEI